MVLHIVSSAIFYAPYTNNISMAGLYSGIHWNIEVKPFDISPSPAYTPSPHVYRPNLA